LLEAEERFGLVSAATDQRVQSDSWSTGNKGELLSIIILLRPESPSPQDLLAQLRTRTPGVVEVLIVDLGAPMALDTDGFSDCIRLDSLIGSPASRLNQAIGQCSGHEILICESDMKVEAGWRARLYEELYSWTDVAASLSCDSDTTWPEFVQPGSPSLMQASLWRRLGGLMVELDDDRLALADLFLRAQLMGLRLRSSTVTTEAPNMPSTTDFPEECMTVFAERWMLPYPIRDWQAVQTGEIRDSADDLRRVLTRPLMPLSQQPPAPAVLLHTLSASEASP
jgi:hypothetical protein